MDEKINLDFQYLFFMNKYVGDKMKVLGEVQRIEMKRAFAAGMGQAMLLMQNEISTIDVQLRTSQPLSVESLQRICKVYEKLVDDCLQYWDEQK